MEKIVKIGTKEYKMKASGYTLFAYKNEFKSDLLKDLKKVVASFKDVDLNAVKKSNETETTENKDVNLNDTLLDNLDLFDGVSDMIDILYKISFIMIREADKNQVANFEEFLKNIDTMLDDNDWISDVIDLVTSPFGGRAKAH